ncbi:hypothetical protein PHYBLDRAFT_151650 [Phycomyces blakesleeanus NRRL 1555(-)]|uniref:Uncharacterized protein n=1 Tax=Phycomyces blakesleeanus (strain ATCC 8743b / DSM 1359 / FGSC 10004 / NBRC 33097 / NRRL 1555) TaxID=763407 RepID=A0A167K717_PHYB8|nr:hypothetical protein PHYBLDRAFT_151650 [Phycomyces blakesleeanus NRRL 1555(-)]OAD67398.1 hypothetical protein PHYBLDRAFT_151650 [Phycomyces blakesleeanus NRRL 1555(-)]|eukprot:XP_018285438.1 hypothetical protein PHYBLDRAFT_151650 [Phycomyces blakesleeanus NRRL 1555(-)]
MKRQKRKAKEELKASKDKKVRTLADFGFAVPALPDVLVAKPLVVQKPNKDQINKKLRATFELLSEKVNSQLVSNSDMNQSFYFKTSKLKHLKEQQRFFRTNLPGSVEKQFVLGQKNFLNLKKKMLVWLRAQKPERRTVIELKKYLNKTLFPACLHVKGNTATSTAWKCMRAWGMMTYKEYMSDFMGKNEEIEISPLLLENQKKLVMVTHDKSTFYAHDGKVDMWLEKGERYIRKKGQGCALIVSKLHVSAAYESYWTSKDMLDQLKNHAIPLFKSLHEGCTGVFIFDQSSNHKVYATDVLVATHMILKPKVVSENDKFVFKDTTFLKDGCIIPQLFYETVFEVGRKRKGSVEKRQFVGVQQILQKHGLASPVAGSPSMIKRFYKKTWRYIEAYSKFLDAKDADAEVKKFILRISKSHCSIGIHD